MFTTAQNDPDFQLVQQLQNDPNSRNFEKLVRKYHEQIYRFSFLFLGNSEDAADCCQEVFIKIFRHLSSFGSESSLSTSCIYRFALNTCKDMSRWKKTRPRRRQVLILRDIDGRSYEEISDITGIRSGTVRSTLARARFQLASLLKEFRHEMQ